MRKLAPIQSFALWAAVSTAGFQVLTALGEGKHVEAFFVTALVIWPLWFVWRFLRFIWRAASVVSMSVTDRHERMKAERAARW